MELFNKITEENFILFAAKHYYNPRCIEAEEFFEDIQRIKRTVRISLVVDARTGNSSIYFNG